MGRRRGNGEGSIYRGKDGRWRGEISLGYKDGKPVRKVLYGSTRTEVADKLKEQLRNQQIGVNIKPERQTLGSFLDSWLKAVAAKNRTQTLRSYTWIVSKHLKPGLGSLPLEKVSAERVQSFLTERHASGLSAGTVKHIRATLRAALSQAERWSLVHRNVAKLVSVPRGKKFEAKILTPEQANTFLRYLATHRPNREALYVTAIMLGPRRGELLGLRWENIDLLGGELTIAAALQRVKGEGLQLAELKTAKSRRTLRIPQLCVAALSRWRVLQAEEKQWAGTGWEETGFVFTNTAGRPLHPDDISHELPTLLKEAKLPQVRLHDLRHSCASLLLSMGVHAKLVQETLGHSSYQLTMDTYSHMMPALRNEVADRMDDVFRSTPTGTPTKPDAQSVN